MTSEINYLLLLSKWFGSLDEWLLEMGPYQESTSLFFFSQVWLVAKVASQLMYEIL
jgi:hypothetical protein